MLGLRVEEVAVALGKSSSTIQHLERGGAVISVAGKRTLLAYCRLLASRAMGADVNCLPSHLCPDSFGAVDDQVFLAALAQQRS